LLLSASAQVVPAQPFPAEDSLSATQKIGRNLFTQHCVVCHVHTQITAGPHFGPALSGQSLGGQDDVMAEVVSNGTPNMPGFKYQFEPQQIRAIVSYVKALPLPPPPGPPR
jgi:mono/diheme cytochrome c family protein